MFVVYEVVYNRGHGLSKLSDSDADEVLPASQISYMELEEVVKLSMAREKSELVRLSRVHVLFVST